VKLSHILLVIILSLATAYLTARYAVPHSNGEAVVAKESAYDRVLRTGVLRCGYADSPPYVLTQDAATGKVSGILPDVIEAAATKLKVKVEWTENTGWGNAIESLHDHRTDVFCAGLWRNAERGRYVGYGVPIYYVAVYPYVAVDDHRFDKDLDAINSPSVRISVMDGEMSDIIAKTHFPKAKEVSVPQLGQYTDILMNVTTHKADVTFAEVSLVDAFTKANPHSLRPLQSQPFEVFQSSLAVDIRETQLRDMLDNTLAELQNQGVVDVIISKYSSDPKEFLRVAKPYQ
jgi:ABC-type amino acid transport substrate-binding protein